MESITFEIFFIFSIYTPSFSHFFFLRKILITPRTRCAYKCCKLAYLPTYNTIIPYLAYMNDSESDRNRLLNLRRKVVTGSHAILFRGTCVYSEYRRVQRFFYHTIRDIRFRLCSGLKSQPCQCPHRTVGYFHKILAIIRNLKMQLEWQLLIVHLIEIRLKRQY